MTPTRLLLALAVSGAFLAPSLARASDSPSARGMSHAQEIASNASLSTPKLSLDPGNAPAEGQEAQVLTLHTVGSRIHGFGDFRIATSYITPRGLVALESSPQFQAVVGLVFNLYSGDGFINDFSLVAGAWGDFNPNPDKSKVTGADIWVEEDFFAGFSMKVAKNWTIDYTIQAWTFPDLTDNNDEINPTTEYNMDLKVGFNDAGMFGLPFSINPYVDIFWNFCGDSSPVVADALLGKNNHTFYVELGIAPSYTHTFGDLPVTFTLPTYVQVGDSSFWGETPGGDRSNIGVFSTGIKISAPLKFIPADFGNWNAYVGFTYYHTCNPALTYINSGATGGDRNLCLGYGGVGFNF